LKILEPGILINNQQSTIAQVSEEVSDRKAIILTSSRQ